MAKEIQIEIENEFVNSDKSSTDLGVTVFDRAFRKLVEEKSTIGKLFPVYLKVQDQHYTFAVFTLNTLGSTSLFLELPERTFFDHITFGKNLANPNIHLTHIVDGARKKVTKMKDEILSNGTHLVMTLIIEDLDIFKPAPRIVLCPTVGVEQVELLQDALFTRGGYNGSGTLEAAGESGAVVIQLFLIPAGVDPSVLHFTKTGLGEFAKQFDERNFEHIKIHRANLGHEFQNEYQLGLIAFRYPVTIGSPLYLGIQMDKSGVHFNSQDEELNKSVIDKARASIRKSK